jgi:hypothetical protein
MPLIDDLDHLDTALVQEKAQRPLFAAIAGMAFHPNS